MRTQRLYIIENTTVKEVKFAAEFIAKFPLPQRYATFYDIWLVQNQDNVEVNYYGNDGINAIPMLYEAVKIIKRFIKTKPLKS